MKAEGNIRSFKRFDAVRWSPERGERMRALAEWLQRRGSVLVAFSGGVDSTFLAAVAYQALGEQALAVTADSPSLPRAELQAARELGVAIGIPHVVVKTTEMEDPAFTANPAERCYHCKKELFGQLVRMAGERGLTGVIDGSNHDDLGDFRPGSRAAAEWGVARPLQELGFTKREIRSASRMMGLPTATKPAMACLASRLPYGTTITTEALARIERSEAALNALGFEHCRVRLHGDVARIEVPPTHLPRAFRLREAIVDALTSTGNRYVTLDLRGYRTGSMNESLTTGKKA